MDHMAIEKLTKSQIEKITRALPITAGRNGDARSANARRYHDGGGLHLRVARPTDPDATEPVVCWVFRYRDVSGRPREMGFGRFPDVSAKRAREKASDARSQLAEGKDPIRERESVRASLALEQSRRMTFQQCTDAFLAEKDSGWSEKHRKQWRTSLDTYVNPVIGSLAVCNIDTQLVVRVLRHPMTVKEDCEETKVPFWNARPETAGRVRGRIESILEWARVNGHRDGDNPARWNNQLEHRLPSIAKLKTVEHFPAMPWAELPAFMQDLRKENCVGALALEFTILTAARTDQTLGARWSEIDMDKALWTIPAERMKWRAQHRVPLTPRAMDVLEAIRELKGRGPFVFPGQNGIDRSNKAIMMDTVRRRMKRDGFDIHGFRSSFLTWVQDTRKHDVDLADKALAHKEKDKVKAAYARSDMVEQRRGLMAAWADWCTSEPTGNIVGFHRAA
jgi:integrase